MTPMTEAEWLVCGEPSQLVSELFRRRYGQSPWPFSDRKQRLIGCACCRVIWDDLASDAQRHAVEVGERFADGKASAEELHQAWQRAGIPGSTAASRFADEANFAIPNQVIVHVRGLRRGQVAGEPDEVLARQLCEAIRDVFGNPYREARIRGMWLAANGGQVRAIAQGIDAEGRFGETSILGDALEDAGCDDAEILSHARQPCHYRGCWLIDAILGKV